VKEEDLSSKILDYVKAECVVMKHQLLQYLNVRDTHPPYTRAIRTLRKRGLIHLHHNAYARAAADPIAARDQLCAELAKRGSMDIHDIKYWFAQPDRDDAVCLCVWYGSDVGIIKTVRAFVNRLIRDGFIERIGHKYQLSAEYLKHKG
jgi:hypothetical protein